MAQDRRRIDRIGELLKGELAELALRKVKDPRLQGLTVTDVSVSPDLSVARVYFAAADDEAASRIQAALEKAAPFLRREVGSRLRLRKTPELRFRRDEALEQGTRIEAILREIGRDEGEGERVDAPAGARAEEPGVSEPRERGGEGS